MFKGLQGDRVYLADPASGNTRMSIYRFEPEWPGYILAIDKKR
jgi:predicted double-glycine peptidase